MEPEAKRPKLTDDADIEVSGASPVVTTSAVPLTTGVRCEVSTPDGTTQSTVAAAKPAEEPAAAEGGNEEKKLRRQKYAILLAYCGAQYNGMQRNEPFITVEGELISALLKGGCIDPEDVADPGRMSYQRASRTDKGVSAVHQVVSLKMHDNIVERVNEYLPGDIRTFACIRTTKGFSCFKQATGRAYEYCMPSFALAPSLSQSISTYRIDEERIKLTNSLLAKYIGTHSYHNFTSGRKADDPSCLRVMRSFEVKKTFLSPASNDGEKDMEFVILRVTGQSFMLHQIRKMIGLVLAILKGCCPEQCMAKAWLPGRVDVPKAPGLGLLLDEVYFHGYDRRYGGDGVHKPLVWTDYEEEIAAFKEKRILSSILLEERKTNGMMKWLHTLPLHEYDKFTGHKEGKRTDATAAAAAAAADAAAAIEADKATPMDTVASSGDVKDGQMPNTVAAADEASGDATASADPVADVKSE